MIMAVSREASTFWDTSSAVEADPKPLGPGIPVISEKMPIFPLSMSMFLRRKKGVRRK